MYIVLVYPLVLQQVLSLPPPPLLSPHLFLLLSILPLSPHLILIKE